MSSSFEFPGRYTRLDMGFVDPPLVFTAHGRGFTVEVLNDRGRVLTPDGEPLPGVYAVGWIKRGPTGILGTNKRDADETVRCLAEDIAADRLPTPPDPAPVRIEALLAERKPDLVTVEGWRAIDAQELEQGSREQRPRVKLASRDELVDAAREATGVAAR